MFRSGAAARIFVQGVQKFSRTRWLRNPHHTLTKSLHVHDYHKYHRSTLGVRGRTPGSPPQPATALSPG